MYVMCKAGECCEPVIVSLKHGDIEYETFLPITMNNQLE